MAIEEPHSYQDTEGWVSPRGRFYPLDGALSHGQWVVNNYDWLTQSAGAKLPPKKELVKDVISKGSDYVRNLLVGQGWLHIYSPKVISVRSLASQNSAVTDYILTSGNGYNDFDVIEVYSLDTNRWTKKTYKQWKGVEEEDGFSAFSSRTKIAGWGEYKAWVNPSANEIFSWKCDGGGEPHHVEKLPEEVDNNVGNYDNFEEEYGEGSVIEHANSLGWYQVSIDSGNLYITAFDEDDVTKIIKMLPEVFWSNVGEIITEAGDDVKVDEGEDIAKAWGMRNSIRKRISRRDLKYKYSSSNFSKAWVNPENRLIEIWNTDGVMGRPHHEERLPKQLDNLDTYGMNKEMIIEAAESEGWIQVSFEKPDLYINSSYDDEIESILQMLPDNFLNLSKYIITDARDTVAIDEGEDALKAWRMRNSIRKRINGSAITASSFGWKRAWVTPDNEVIEITGNNDHHMVLPHEFTEAVQGQEYWGEKANSLAIEGGWVRIGKDEDVITIQAKDDDAITRALENLPSDYMLVDWIVYEYGSNIPSARPGKPKISVDEGEDALKAWRMRNSIRKRVQSSFSMREASVDLRLLNYELKDKWSENEYDLYNALHLYFTLEVILANNSIDAEARQIIKSHVNTMGNHLKQEVYNGLNKWHQQHTSGDNLLGWDEYDSDAEATLAWGFVENGHSSWRKQSGESIDIKLYEPAAKILKKMFADEDYVSEEIEYGGPSEWNEYLSQDIREQIVQKLTPYIFKQWRKFWGKDVDAATRDVLKSMKRLESAQGKDIPPAISLALNTAHVHGKMAEHLNLSEDELDGLSNISQSDISKLEDEILKPDYEKVASVKLSSRDAVKDTINYWDKAKNKDFSKYWRQLKKKKILPKRKQT